MKPNKMTRVLSIILIGLSCACTAQTSKRTFETFEHEGKLVDYAIQLPKDFDPKKTYPVAIGPSEVKDKDDQSYYWRGTNETYGWILVDFRIYNSSSRIEQVRAFLEHLRGKYYVEGNKFHTICFSANSAGIFDMVMKIPEEFHSITGMAGNPGSRDSEQLKALKEVKVRFVVGDRDTYWMNAAKDRHARLMDAGIDSDIEIIKDGKHVLTQLIGEGVIS